MNIPQGEYSIGLRADALDSAYGRVGDGRIKRDFLAGAIPAHQVRVGPVMIRRLLTTTGEYSEFAAERGYRTEAEQDGWGWVLHDGRWHKRSGVDWKKPFGPSSSAHCQGNGAMPAMQVTWNDATAYCAWLSDKIGRAVRLPREAEWEVFAGMCGVAGAGECGGRRALAHGPGEYFAAVDNALRAGACCSIGIVWEWTDDWYDRYPGGPDSKDYGRVYKVLRGGSLLSNPVQRAREFRLRKCPTARSPYYGFRIAVTG